MTSFCFALIAVLALSFAGAERRWCRPTIFDASVNPDGWMTYDDVTYTCVECSPDSISLLSKARVDSFECCDGAIVTKGDCYVTQGQIPGGNCSSGIKCDAIKQCVDGSDETGCGECNGTALFSCTDHADTQPCISTNQVCDAVKDCLFGLDETGCPWHRGWCDGFLCGAPHQRCIPSYQVCDGSKQCLDGSDEYNCRYCLNQFRCEVYERSYNSSSMTSQSNTTTAQCVGSFRVCDGSRDCDNNVDERGCYRWREWSNWVGGCETSCTRNRSRTCVDKNGASVSPRNCFDVEDYHDQFGNPGLDTETQRCPRCDVTTAALLTSSLSTTGDVTTATTSQMTDAVTTTTAAANVSMTSSTTMTSSSMLTSSTNYSEMFMPQIGNSTASPPFNVTSDVTTMTSQRPSAAGISLSLIIALGVVSAFILIVVIICSVFCCTEQRRRTGKWSPRRRNREPRHPPVPRMYHDVPLGSTEALDVPNPKPATMSSFSGNIDSGIDDDQNSTSSTLASKRQSKESSPVRPTEHVQLNNTTSNGSNFQFPSPPAELASSQM